MAVAFVVNPNEEEQAAGGGAGPLATPPPSGAGTGGAGGGGGPQMQTATAGSSPAGTGFANLQQYLDANKEQTDRLAQQLVDRLGGERQSFLEDVSGKGDEFRQSLESANPLDTSVVDLAAQRPEGLSDAQIEDFRRLRRGEFLGPTSMEGTSLSSDLRNLYSDLVGRADLTKDIPGRTQLVSELTENPTLGQSALDTSLLQGSPTAGDKFKTFRETVGTDASAIDQAISQSEQDVAARQAALRDIAGGIQSQFLSGYMPDRGQIPVNIKTTAPPGVLSTLQSDLAMRRNQAQSEANRLLAEAYGAGQAPEFNITPEQVASAQDFAREAALEQLFEREFDVLDRGLEGTSYMDALNQLLASAPPKQQQMRAVTENGVIRLIPI